MARTTQTELAVLGGLSVMPMTGYALRAAIKEVLGHFWSESFGQIYPTLGALTAQRLVERREGGRPGAYVFSLTDAGRARLRELLAGPPQSAPPRSGVRRRLFFGKPLGMEGCRALLLDAKADAEARLHMFAGLRQEVAHDEDVANDRTFILLTISAGEHSARAALAWAEESLAVLDSLPEQGGLT